MHFSKKCVDIWCAQWYYKQADSFEAAQKINIRVWRSLVSRLNGVQEAAGSNPVTRTILTKRYRCVWRKARRINRFRSFSGPDFFFQTIDANRCFRASAPIRTGRFPFSGRCVQPVPFLNGDFPADSGIFLKKNHKDLGVVLLVLTD